MKKGERPQFRRFRVIGALLALVFAISLLQPLTGAKAAGEQFTLNITYGFDNQARVGSSVPFNITITNNGGDFNGTVQVIVPDHNKNVMFEKDLALAAGATKTVSITVPVAYYTSYANVRVCNSKGRAVQAQLEQVKLLKNLSTLNIGVLSDDFSALSYLSGIDLYDSGSYGRISTRIFELDEESFPIDDKSFNMLDFVLITNYSTDKLSDVQLSALNEWILNGGVVIVGTGSTMSKTLSGLKNLPAFRAIKTDSVRYSTYDTSYGLNTCASELLDIQQISSGYYQNDYRYTELASYGITVYDTVTKQLREAATKVLEEADPYSYNPISDYEVFERYYTDNKTEIWREFADNFGFSINDMNEPAYEYKMKSNLYDYLLEPFCSDALLAAQNGGSTTVNYDYSEYVTAEFTNVDIDMSYSTVYADDRNSSDVKFPLAKTYQYGLGRVSVVSLDFTQNPFASFKNNTAVIRMFLNGAHSSYMMDLIRVYNDKAQNYYASGSIYSQLFAPLTSVAAPPVLLYIGLLILYLVLTFVSFGILKKKRKNIFFWVTQAGLALFFGILVFIFSFTTKIVSGEFRTAQFKELTGSAERDLNISALITPSKKKHKLTLQNKFAFSVEPEEATYFSPNNQPSLDDFNLGINMHPEDSTYIINNDGALNSTFFAGTNINAEKQGSFVIEGDFDEDYPDITVTNNSGYDLKRVIVVGMSKYFLLGDIQNGQSVKVDSTTDFTYSYSGYYSQSRINMRDYLTAGERFGFVNLMMGTNSDWYRRTMIRIYQLVYIKESNMDKYSNRFIVCGFPDKNVSEQFQTEKKYKESTYTMVYQVFEK